MIDNDSGSIAFTVPTITALADVTPVSLRLARTSDNSSASRLVEGWIMELLFMVAINEHRYTVEYYPSHP